MALIGPAVHIASGPVVEAKQVQPLQTATLMCRLTTSFHILSLKRHAIVHAAPDGQQLASRLPL